MSVAVASRVVEVTKTSRYGSPGAMPVGSVIGAARADPARANRIEANTTRSNRTVPSHPGNRWGSQGAHPAPSLDGRDARNVPGRTLRSLPLPAGIHLVISVTSPWQPSRLSPGVADGSGTQGKALPILGNILRRRWCRRLDSNQRRNDETEDDRDSSHVGLSLVQPPAAQLWPLTAAALA